jgi:hypothetical protein
MRTRFSHLVPLTASELESIWSTAILTVDTNVLLDLYRFHEEMRDALLTTLEKFKGRLWLSNQAAEEFFRNRNTVIASAFDEFDGAEGKLKTFEKALATAVTDMRGNRAIPKNIPTMMFDEVKSVIEKARAAVSAAKQQHPNFFASDPVLARILNMFEGAVGDQPSEEGAALMHAEGERRISEKVPPCVSVVAA